MARGASTSASGTLAVKSPKARAKGYDLRTVDLLPLPRTYWSGGWRRDALGSRVRHPRPARAAGLVAAVISPMARERVPARDWDYYEHLIKELGPDVIDPEQAIRKAREQHLRELG
jgi:hypothetical protein